MFANTQMMGVDTAFPDVCLTPAPPSPSPVPIPYPNIALGPTAKGMVSKVLFMYGPAHNTGSGPAFSNGDNLGVNMGTASGSVMKGTKHVTAANTVLVGGKPCTRLTSVTQQNGTNAPGVRSVPSQVMVLVLAP